MNKKLELGEKEGTMTIERGQKIRNKRRGNIGEVISVEKDIKGVRVLVKIKNKKGGEMRVLWKMENVKPA